MSTLNQFLTTEEIVARSRTNNCNLNVAYVAEIVARSRTNNCNENVARSQKDQCNHLRHTSGGRQPPKNINCCFCKLHFLCVPYSVCNPFFRSKRENLGVLCCFFLNKNDETNPFLYRTVQQSIWRRKFMYCDLQLSVFFARFFSCALLEFP